MTFVITALMSSKLARAALAIAAGVLIITALWFGFWAWVGKREAAAAAAERALVVAEYQAATDAESTRRMAAIDDARRLGELVADRLIEKQRGFVDETRRAIAPLVARNRDRPCLDADSVRALKGLTAGRPPGDGARDLAGEAAGGARGAVRGSR